MAKPAGAWLAAAVVALSGSGCHRNVRGPCDTPPPFHVYVQASPQLNPDAQGHPLPTVVQLMQVSTKTAAEQQDYTELLKDPSAALGKELLKVDELMVDPGQTLSRWVPRDPKARFVAAVGVFRQPSGTTWRAIVPLPGVLKSECKEQRAEKKGAPTKYDEHFRLMLEEYRISAITPTPTSGKGT